MSKHGSEPWVKDGIKRVLKSWGAWWYMPVQTGMGEGGIHDFIACVPTVITPDMIGKTVGLFVSIDAKELGLIETLWRQAGKGGKHSHPSADGRFISNRSLQTLQYEGIIAADGIAMVIDNPDSLEAAWRIAEGRIARP